jgi:hypothetical protein
MGAKVRATPRGRKRALADVRMPLQFGRLSDETEVKFDRVPDEFV